MHCNLGKISPDWPLTLLWCRLTSLEERWVLNLPWNKSRINQENLFACVSFSQTLPNYISGTELMRWLRTEITFSSISPAQPHSICGSTSTGPNPSTTEAVPGLGCVTFAHSWVWRSAYTHVMTAGLRWVSWHSASDAGSLSCSESLWQSYSQVWTSSFCWIDLNPVWGFSLNTGSLHLKNCYSCGEQHTNGVALR